MKKALFTCNVGGYDNSPLPPIWNGWDTILFTDDLSNIQKGWSKVIHIETTDRPDLVAKKVKWLPHQLLPEYDLYCWYDSNMRLIRVIPPTPFRIIHHKRSSVQQEADALIGYQHRFTTQSINKQLNYYKEQGFTDKQGLFLNGFFCRENSLIENEIGEEVYNIMVNFTSRDMLALPFVLEKLNYTYDKSVLKNMYFFNRFVRMKPHKNLKPPVYDT